MIRLIELMSGRSFRTNPDGWRFLTRTFIVNYMDVENFRTSISELNFGMAGCMEATESFIEAVDFTSKTATVVVEFEPSK